MCMCVRVGLLISDAEFKCGRESLEDDPHPGRLVCVNTQETIDKVHDMILTDEQNNTAGHCNRTMNSQQTPNDKGVSSLGPQTPLAW